MIFHEIYSCYYNTVAEILSCAVKGNLTQINMKKIIDRKAFSESFLNIIPALKNQQWQLLDKNMSTQIKHIPTMPLTLIEKRWLKAISLDKRIRLFGDNLSLPDDVEPLFNPDDFVFFDKYSDGDNFEDEEYIKHFRTILTAFNTDRKLHMEFINKNGFCFNIVCIPLMLEFSEKDDKFRIYVYSYNKKFTVNLSSIKFCVLGAEYVKKPILDIKKEERFFVMELTDERNALERVMMHFAHFKKEAEKTADRKYRLKVFYNKSDETELVIRVLSFGPMVKIIEPDGFCNLIKQRLQNQQNLNCNI